MRIYRGIFTGFTESFSQDTREILMETVKTVALNDWGISIDFA